MPFKDISAAIGFLDVEAVQEFLEKDPKTVDEKNKQGCTPLHHLACWRPLEESVERFNQVFQLLVDKHANPLLRDKKFRTPLEFAEQLNLYPEYIQRLRDYTAAYKLAHGNTQEGSSAQSETEGGASSTATKKLEAPGLHRRFDTSKNADANTSIHHNPTSADPTIIMTMMLNS